MSQNYQKLPSEILHIEDSYIAYILDEAIYYASLIETPPEEETEDDTIDLNEIIAQGGMRGVDVIIED